MLIKEINKDLYRNVLGKNLRIIPLYPRIPRQKEGVKFDIFNYEMLFNDPKTKNIIKNGLTIGCFYIESPGMRALLKKLAVEDYMMLTAASSIIRPGVAESGMMQEFIARHKNPALRKYFIPQLEEVLGDTYGVMIYQEDVIKVAHHIAGLSLEEADLLRRAMSGKMRSSSAMESLTKRFLRSCFRQGLGYEESKELWRQIESFAGYSFCKAHSASFALLSYQVAFLKAHYPAEFMASVLSNGGGFYAPGVYIEESKRIGLKVLLPCVNKSRSEYTGSKKTIRIGLMAIKNLSSLSIDTIINEREQNGFYQSLADFIVRTKLGPQETGSLIKCGAMDCFRVSRITMLRLLDIYIRRRKMLEDCYNDLFMEDTFLLEKEMTTTDDYSITERCRMEYEAFDFMVTKHPLYFFEEYISAPDIIHAADMFKYHNKKIKMIGWYMSSKRIKTRKGDIMKFLSLEDLTGTFEAVIFPKTYNIVAEKTLSMGPYIIEGKVDAVNGNNLIVEKLEVLTQTALKAHFEKDSVENKYFGDVESFKDEEVFNIGVNTQQLVRAYAGSVV